MQAGGYVSVTGVTPRRYQAAELTGAPVHFPHPRSLPSRRTYRSVTMSLWRCSHLIWQCGGRGSSVRRSRRASV